MKLKYIAVFSLLLLSLLSVLPVIAQTEQKFESQEKYDDWDNVGYDGQSFIPQTTHKLTKVILKLSRLGSPSGDLIVSIRNTNNSGIPTGNDLVSKSMLAMDVTNESSPREYEFVFDEQITLEQNVKYAIIFRCAGVDPSNYILAWFNTGDIYPDIYPRGTYLYYDGVVWVIDDTIDFYFSEWGYEPLPPHHKTTPPAPQEEAMMPSFPLTFYTITVLLFFGGLYLYAKRELWLISIPLIPVIAWLLWRRPYPPWDFYIAIILAVIAISLLLNKLREK
jgi:hypothetical protein